MEEIREVLSKLLDDYVLESKKPLELAEVCMDAEDFLCVFCETLLTLLVALFNRFFFFLELEFNYSKRKHNNKEELEHQVLLLLTHLISETMFLEISAGNFLRLFLIRRGGSHDTK